MWPTTTLRHSPPLRLPPRRAIAIAFSRPASGTDETGVAVVVPEVTAAAAAPVINVASIVRNDLPRCSTILVEIDNINTRSTHNHLCLFELQLVNIYHFESSRSE